MLGVINAKSQRASLPEKKRKIKNIFKNDIKQQFNKNWFSVSNSILD